MSADGTLCPLTSVSPFCVPLMVPEPVFRAVREDGSDFPDELRPGVTTLRTGVPQNGVAMGIYRPDKSLRWIAVNCEPCVLVITTELEVKHRNVNPLGL